MIISPYISICKTDPPPRIIIARDVEEIMKKKIMENRRYH